MHTDFIPMYLREECARSPLEENMQEQRVFRVCSCVASMRPQVLRFYVWGCQSLPCVQLHAASSWQGKWMNWVVSGLVDWGKLE